MDSNVELAKIGMTLQRIAHATESLARHLDPAFKTVGELERDRQMKARAAQAAHGPGTVPQPPAPTEQR